jgi:hypothetical protein
MLGGVHGDDETKVYAELCKVADEWIAIHKTDGLSLPEPTAGKDCSGKFVVRVGRDLHRELAIIEDQTGRRAVRARFFIDATGQSEKRRWRPETATSPTFYLMPYRSLVSHGSVNMLAAGRAIDADEGAFGAIRVMVNCMQTGQAAGVAAHVALRAGKTCAEVPAEELRRLLSEQGAVVI